MPGRPSTTSEIESPTGCTKQMIRVACSATPAAELMRPAGMKPSSCAWKKRRSHCARSLSRSTWASARATRRRTSVTVCSLPLAYFSSSVSRLISCSATAETRGAGSWISILDEYTVSGPARRRLPEVQTTEILSAGGGRGGLRLVRLGRGAARVLERVGDLGVAEAQRELDRAVAFLGGLAGVGAVAQQQLDHRQAAAHRRVGEGGVAVVVVQVGVEVHRQHLLRVHQVVLLDRVEQRADAFGALLLGPGLQAGGHQLDHVVDQADPDQRDQREDDR